MLTTEELEGLLEDIEAENVERTESTRDTDKFCEAICAFANDFAGAGRPGYLLIGVRPDGRPAGIQITDQLLQNLGALRSHGRILPPPAMSVTKRDVRGRHEIAVVEVFPSDMPPVRFDGRVWIRVGPRRAVATEAEERLLTERRGAHLARTFDARPCRALALSDLSLDLFKITYLPNAVDQDTLEANHRDTRLQLASLRFYSPREDCPTNAGGLLFCGRVTDVLSGAYVQFVRYAGATLGSDVVSDKAVSGDLLTILRQLDELIAIHIGQHPVAETLLRERTHADYPARALREIVMNAVMHRDYEATGPISINWFDDRVEVQSPGGLYGESRPENFPHLTAYRNPVVAEAMKVLGYVNRFGRGIAVAREQLEKNGSPAPQFEVGDPHRVLVVVRRRL